MHEMHETSAPFCLSVCPKLSSGLWLNLSVDLDLRVPQFSECSDSATDWVTGNLDFFPSEVEIFIFSLASRPVVLPAELPI
jgi:hypothetical protein